jgi:predicted esterase
MSQRLGAWVAGLVAVVVVAGCTVPEPPGAAPLRYRDTVFTNITKTSDLQYGSAPDNNGNPVALLLDVYQPTGDTVAQRPAIVWVHGGGYCCGDKSSSPSADLAQKFAHLGYVTVSINYRLLAPNGCTAGSGNVSPTCLAAAVAAQHDAQAAVRWLRANATTYRIDSNRIGIGGDSAGAITAAFVGLDSEDPGTSGNPGFPSTVGAFMSLSGGLPAGAFASAGDAPGLLFSGTADPVVPYSWSVQTAANLLNAHVVAFLEPFAGAGHDPYTEFESQIFSQSDYFFYTFLDAAHAQGQPAAAGRAFAREVDRMGQRYPGFAHALARQLRREHRSPQWLRHKKHRAPRR